MPQYTFLPPRIKRETDGEAGFPPWTLKPAVFRAHWAARAACTEITTEILNGLQGGRGWNSRTRYAEKKPWDVNLEFRKSTNLPTDLPLLDQAFGILDHHAKDGIAHFGLQPNSYELEPVDDQCLVYQAGDYLGEHADDSALGTDENGASEWHIIKPERHIVGILWLTGGEEADLADHRFTGGALRINSIIDSNTRAPLEIAPKIGDMAFFPANPWFRHEVMRVISGTRIALTRWWKVVRVAADDK